MTEKKNMKLEAALKYAGIGLNIIPTGANKRPLIEWKPFQDRYATIEEINLWWQQWPDANPALVTGKISGIVALDLDIKHGRTSNEFTLPITACAKSGSGGEHFFFRYPIKGFVKSATAIDGEGVDSRGDGGYILLAPSVNENGGVYEWIVPIESKEDLAEMPEWFKKLIEDNTADKKWLIGKDGVPEGLRNATATSLSGRILSSMKSELWESLGWEQLQIWNNKNTSPLPEKELRNTWESIKKKHTKNNISRPNNLVKDIKSKALTRCFKDIESVPINWLWKERIALGKLTMIVGDPGLGKSLVTIAIATNVSMGYPWPVDKTIPPVGSVIFISAEDDPADTIKPRLEAAGADCSRIHLVEAIQEENIENETIERMFSFERDIKTLEELLIQWSDCRLVIIDPISAYLGKADSNKNSDIRGLLAPLSKLAEKYKTAFVLVSHLNKNSKEGNSLYRTMGSLAFIAAVRTAYIVIKDKDNPDRRLVMPLKSNISKEQSGLAYSIIEAENNAPVLAWENNPVEITTEEALALPESKEDHTATHEALDFLIKLLADGPVKTNEVMKEARQAGISEKPLRSAREKLGIKPQKTSFDGGWMWSIPEDAPDSEVALPGKEGNLGTKRQLGENVSLDKFVEILRSEEEIQLKVEKDKDGIEITPNPQKSPIQGDLPF